MADGFYDIATLTYLWLQLEVALSECRRLVVDAESRIYVMDSGGRTQTVDSESRIYVVDSGGRTQTVDSESRTYAIDCTA